jgi:hypothetical protein
MKRGIGRIILPTANGRVRPRRLPRAARVVRRIGYGRAREGSTMELVVALVSIAVIWLVVIYGSIYVNKNVQ